MTSAPQSQREIPGSPRQPLLFVISAPSGAGKTSLVRALLAGDQRLAVSVSHTTRPPRATDVDGSDYHFVSPAEFQAMCDAGEFLEHASVFGHAYGTSRQAVLDRVRGGQDVILEIDWQGAAQVRAAWPDAVTVFILPPSREALRSRLEGRGQDQPAVIARRMEEATHELAQHADFDHLVVNDDFEAATQELATIVTGCRHGNPPPRANHTALLSRLLDL